MATGLKQAAFKATISRSLWLAILSGIISALIIPVLFIILGLSVELLVPAGEPAHTDAETKEFAAWCHERDLVPEEAQGIITSVYYVRNRPVIGPVMDNIYCNVPSLQSANLTGLSLLALAGVILTGIESLFLWLLQRSSYASALDFTVELKERIHDQALRLGVADLVRGRSARPDQLIYDNVENIRGALVAQWRDHLRSIILLVVLVALALYINVWLTIAASAFGVLVLQMTTLLQGRANSRRIFWNDLAQIERDTLADHLGKISLVTDYQLSEIPGEPFFDVLRRYRKAAMNAATAYTIIGPIVLVAAALGSGLLLLLIGINAFRTPPAIGMAGAVVLGISLLCAYFPIRRLIKVHRLISDATADYEKITSYLHRNPGLAEKGETELAPETVKEIRFDSVTLADGDGKKLADSLDLKIRCGGNGRYAVVCSDPESSFALAGLMIRFFDPAAGHIYYNQMDLRSLSLDSLRKRVKMVTAEASLFSGTVFENIACGDDSFEEIELVDAAKTARAYNVVQQLPHGFLTHIGRDGVQLDPGAAFRIALARAAIRNPAVMVIQEPTEKMDEDSQRYIDEAYRSLARDAVLLLFPARLDAIRSASRIFVLHEGQLHAEGTHEELLQQSDLYRHIVYIRFNPFS